MSPPTTPSKRVRCVLCARPVDTAYAPFCSAGCRDRDLLQWLGEGYRVPGPPVSEDGEEIVGDGLDSKARPPL